MTGLPCRDKFITTSTSGKNELNMKKDNQHEKIVGQCRHCHKTFERLRYSYYILARLCSFKCTTLYYITHYSRSIKDGVINTGLFTPPFDTTNIKWRQANKQVVVRPVTRKEITDHLVTIVPAIYKSLSGQVLRFFYFITPITKTLSHISWRTLNYLAAMGMSLLILLSIFSIASIFAFFKSFIWIIGNTLRASLAAAYITVALALQLLRSLWVIPAVIFSVITIGFCVLVEPLGNYIKSLNHRYPTMPFYESICLVVFAVYASHNYTILSAHANLPDFNISSVSISNKEAVKTEKVAPLVAATIDKINKKQTNKDYIEKQKAILMARIKNREPIKSAPKSKDDNLDSKKSTLLARLKAQQIEIAEKRKSIEANKTKQKTKTPTVRNDIQQNIIKKVTETPRSKDLNKRVMVASIDKNIQVNIKKTKPTIKKHLPQITKSLILLKINPLYTISDFKRGNKTSMNMTFTFDGGSLDNEVATILKTLKDRNIKTTFFLTGNFIESYPNRVKQILSGGHEIANHTLTHPHLTTFEKNRKHNTKVTKKFFLSQLKKTEENYFEVTGKKLAPFWRAPYGEVNKEIISWAFEAGYIHVGWTSNGSARETLDTLDWVAQKNSRIYFSAKEIKNKILNFDKNGSGLSGGIVLMHLGTNRRSDKASSELGAMLDGALWRGYRPVKVSKLYIDKLSNKPGNPRLESLLAKHITANNKKVAQSKEQDRLNSKAEAIRKAYKQNSGSSPSAP